MAIIRFDVIDGRMTMITPTGQQIPVLQAGTTR